MTLIHLSQGASKQRERAHQRWMNWSRAMAVCFATIAAPGCTSEAPEELAAPADEGNPAPVASNDAPDERPHGGSEARSPFELVVRWHDSENNSRAEKMSASIENTSPRTIRADVTVLVSSPVGEERGLPVDTVSIPAKTTYPIELSVAELPVQTAGVASTVILKVKWTRSGPYSSDPNHPGGDHELQTQSDFRFVTWDDEKNFAEAMVRTAKAHIDEVVRPRSLDRQRARVVGVTRLRAIRVLDEHSGKLRALDARALSKTSSTAAIVTAADGIVPTNDAEDAK